MLKGSDMNGNEKEVLMKLIEEKDNKIKELEAKLRMYEVQTQCDRSGDRTQSQKCEYEHFVLTKEEVARYSRHLIISDIGVNGQLALKNSSVLIVGAGGLGCPVAIYLAAAGVGKIGIIDYDKIEMSNLHRQILHSEKDLQTSKAKSVTRAVNNVNSTVQCIAYDILLDKHNALDVIKLYDIVVDASDNVATRYLINDACVLCKKTLISGSALRFEGQLTVYNFNDGPCYRCLYPSPPNAEMVSNCSEAGVVGVVPGIIGCLQALEVIKTIIGLQPSFFKKLLVFDGKQGLFRIVNLRPKKPSCEVCGESPTIKELVDYVTFCGNAANDKEQSLKILEKDERISCLEYKNILDGGILHLLIDVRDPVELEICQFLNGINIPFKKLNNGQKLKELHEILEKSSYAEDAFVICHRGNDSQKAVRILQKEFSDIKIRWRDIEGGYHAWASQINDNFPIY